MPVVLAALFVVAAPTTSAQTNAKLPAGLEHYLQTNGRLYRTGQTKPVVIHRIITKGTQDERMPGVLAEKQQVQDDLISAVSGEEAILVALEEEIQDDRNDLWVAERV